MKNKILNLFLVLIMLISFTGCGKKKEEPKKEPETPVVEENTNDALLWEVKSDTATIYLAGSIHVANDDTYPLQQKLLDAFNASDAIAVEVDVVAMQQDMELMAAMSTMMLYADGTNLTSHVSEETIELFNEYVEKNGLSGLTKDYIDLLYMYKPWILESLITNDLVTAAGFETESGIDIYFLNQAKDKGMEIIEVESAMFQYKMLDGFSDELQELLLRNALEFDRDKGIQQLQDMLEVWETGDIEGLEAILADDTEELTEEELKLYEEYNNKMIVERNIGMTDKVEELLKGDKDVFYMVGSAHMVGEEGIVKLLQDRGYTVTKK